MHPKKLYNKQNIYHNYTDIKQTKRIRFTTQPSQDYSTIKRYESAKQSHHQYITNHKYDKEPLPNILQKPSRSVAWKRIKTQFINSIHNGGLQLQKVLDTNRSRDFSQQIYFLQELRHKNQKLHIQLDSIETLMIQIGLKKQNIKPNNITRQQLTEQTKNQKINMIGKRGR